MFMSIFQAVLKQTDKLKEENLNVSRLSSGKSILPLNLSTVKTCVKIDKIKIFMTNDSLMKVKSITECSLH